MTSAQDGEESGSPASGAAARPADPLVDAGAADDPARSAPPAAPVPPSGQYWQSAPPPPQPYATPMNPIGPQPGYPPQFYPPPGYPPMRPGTNAFAIVAFVTSLVFFVLGPIFGFIALNQIKRTGEQGRGFAIAGIWIGFASAALFIIWIIFFFSVFLPLSHQIPVNP